METQQQILESLKLVKTELSEIKISQNWSTDMQEKTAKSVQHLSKSAATTTLHLTQITDFSTNLVESEALQDHCQSAKSETSLQWSSRLNTRKKRFWNFVKNKAKSELYSNWQSSSPEFIPLKYRPKKIPGETPECSTRRLSEAHFRYQNDTELMKIYAHTHLTKAREVDEGMCKMIHETCSNERVRDKLLHDWRADTLYEESVSNQVWSRHEQFIRRKKREDEVKNCTLFTLHTWAEQLEQRQKKSRKLPNQTNIKNCTMFTTPLP